ncbi:MAG TPA: hypothetical protein VJ346_00115 [Bacteroidales bacterium]|nr:hypothetical protein [Bacteroidales bacterium]
MVEDDSINAALIKVTLRPTGANLIYARDGEEAIDLLLNIRNQHGFT